MFLCHEVAIETDAFISSVHECINTLIEERGVKQLDVPLHLYDNSTIWNCAIDKSLW